MPSHARKRAAPLPTLLAAVLHSLISNMQLAVDPSNKSHDQGIAKSAKIIRHALLR